MRDGIVETVKWREWREYDGGVGGGGGCMSLLHADTICLHLCAFC